MMEHFYFQNHLCIAMELLSINLYKLIKVNSFVGFTTALIHHFCYDPEPHFSFYAFSAHSFCALSHLFPTHSLARCSDHHPVT